MRSFRFQIYDRGTACDDVAVELANCGQAKSQAFDFLAELLKDNGPGLLNDNQPLKVRVTDENGGEVVVLEIRDLARRDRARNDPNSVLKPWF